MTQVDILSIHTMVGSLPVVDAMFRRNGFGGTFSHFGIGGDGSCTQWQDTAYRAAANYNGNWHIVSVECADVGPPFPAWNTNDGNAVPAFSDAQLVTLANLIRTIAPAHNIPIVLIPDAKPGRRGIGYHRQGVPGYMVPGAEQWSTAQGKVCPGNRRIAQIPQIIAQAVNGTGGFLMALSDAEQGELLSNSRQIRDYLGAQGGGNTKTENTVGYKVNDIQAALTHALPILLTDAAQTDGGDPSAVAAAVAAAIPTEIAQQVVEALGAKLAGQE